MSHFGIMKFFDENKGFGFAIDNLDGTEIFVHARNCDPYILPLRKGDLIEYDLTNTKRGPIAVRVRFAQ